MERNILKTFLLAGIDYGLLYSFTGTEVWKLQPSHFAHRYTNFIVKMVLIVFGGSVVIFVVVLERSDCKFWMCLSQETSKQSAIALDHPFPIGLMQNKNSNIPAFRQHWCKKIPDMF